MIALPTRRFTVADYHRMSETGILQPDERVELLDGEVIPMLPIGPFHSGSVDQLAELFIVLGRQRWNTRVQSSIRLDNHSEPEPDIALLRRSPDFHKGKIPTAADVYLVVEVADSWLLIDQQKKLPLYARAGIPEVWILNVPERVLEVYRTPSSTAYGEVMRAQAGEVVAPAAFPDAQIEVAELLSAGA